MNSTTLIIQARVNSKRLPRKVLELIGGKPMILFQIERIKKAKLVNKIILATTNNKSDNPLEKICKEANIEIHRSLENDVLGRYVNCLQLTDSETILRITGDCPFIDPAQIDEYIRIYMSGKYDYLCNNNPPTFPDGLDIEIFSRKSLLEANIFDKNPTSREHVTLWIKNNSKFKKKNIKNKEDLSHLRWTVDHKEDLIVIRSVLKELNNKNFFSWKEVIKLYELKPEIFSPNLKIVRNEGQFINQGQKIWQRAKKIIPGGNMLLSKRSEMFLPNAWPTYFSKAKGINVWDMDNVIYKDFSLMGVGTNILGYGNEEVDNAVNEAIREGNLSTLNCYEEVLLAERLIEIHPWADMVRFARTGGEANAISIRIARAFKSREKIAICGYHGWHDWYLASNLNSSKSLDEHLLPELSTKGIPNSLKDSIFSFSYNNICQLKEIISKNDIAAVKMEVERSFSPDPGFLEEIREICDVNNIILIFDECTSGFRETFGGIHKKYKVVPDMCIFGKALGNGYAITAVIGKEKIMQKAQDTFISSTFWTERIGPTAALKTLEVMEKERSWEKITKNGEFIKKEWQNLAKKYDISITQNGLPALAGFSFNSKNRMAYKTFITQEMLKKGFLATNVCYLSTKHEKHLIEDYLKNLDEIFKKIAECEDGLNIFDLLEGPVCDSGFKRLN